MGSNTAVAELVEQERLSQLLRQMRGSRSQRFFANQLGVSQTALRDWENCRIFPHDGNLALIAQVNGWSLEQLKYFLQTGACPDESAFGRLLEDLNRLQASQAIKAMKVLVRRLETVGVNEAERQTPL